MVVPLFIGMVINTFFPTLLQIGGFTQALSGVGYPTVLGMYLFTVGTKMTIRAAPRMLARGFGLLTAKVGTATLFALAVAHLFDGDILGLSTLAVMVAMSDTNGGMFLALTGVMGEKEDSGTYVVQSIETGPFLTMLIFVGTGLAVIPWLTMVSVIAPIVVGAILGNLDDELKEFFGSHEPIIIPFMAFTLGQTINLKVCRHRRPSRRGARPDSGGCYWRGMHRRRSVARRIWYRRSGGVEHRRQLGCRAAGSGPRRHVICPCCGGRDGSGHCVGHCDRDTDAASDRVVVSAAGADAGRRGGEGRGRRGLRALNAAPLRTFQVMPLAHSCSRWCHRSCLRRVAIRGRVGRAIRRGRTPAQARCAPDRDWG